MVVKDDNDEGSIECDGKDMFVVRGGVRLAKRKDNKWVSLIPGVTVQDIKEKGPAKFLFYEVFSDEAAFGAPADAALQTDDPGGGAAAARATRKSAVRAFVIAPLRVTGFRDSCAATLPSRRQAPDTRASSKPARHPLSTDHESCTSRRRRFAAAPHKRLLAGRHSYV